ncbi:MAG: PEP/pyruvate-binding domain-containing protein [Bacillota bacterium]|jgi:phosphoenolpyruvate synthase/pyruvate phosphate dikinase
MDEMILWLPDIKFRHQVSFGSKAVNLGVIAREMRTPPGFCLSSAAYFQTLKSLGILKKITNMAEEVQGESLDKINEVSQDIFQEFANLDLPEAIEAQLKDAYDQLRKGSEHFLVAVRSSATAEDLPSASFAGQLDSFLNIESYPDMITAIKKCWASLWTPRAIHYRYQKGIGQSNIAMAVIVQEMIPAQAAGVMFTANPITNSRKEFYIEAVKGLGEGLVLGEKNADRYIVEKETLHIISKETIENYPYLTDFQIKTLADHGAKLEFMYEEYQDIEWALYRGEIYLLQTRPITTLEDEEPVTIHSDKMTKIQKEIWTNINERFPEPILPIDGMIVKIYYLSLFNAYKNLGFTVPYVEWRRVEEGNFPEFFVPPAIKIRPTRLFKVKKATGWDIEREWKENEAAFDKYLRLLKDESIKQFPLEIIWEYVEDALRDLQRALTFRYLLYIQYGTMYNLLSRLLTFLNKEEGQVILEGLLSGQNHMTGEVNTKLMELALKAKINPAVKHMIISQEAGRLESALGEIDDGREFLYDFQDFLNKYGDRELSQGLGGLAAPTWRERPEIVWGMLKGILIADENSYLHQDNMPERRKEAEEKLRQLTGKGLFRLLTLGSFSEKLISSARKYNAFRENSHFYLTQAMTVFRTLFLEMGRRLVRRGLLDHEEKIMYLTFFEVKDLIYALYSHQKVSKLEMAEKINSRMQKQERRRKRWSGRKIKVAEQGVNVLSGIGASSGVISGPCKIITDPRDFARLRPGDILVAQYTNPAWTPVFSFIGGLVVEYGSTVSHAAIIAREYGIPAVMGVRGITGILEDGEKVTIDGSRGLVQRNK